MAGVEARFSHRKRALGSDWSGISRSDVHSAPRNFLRAVALIAISLQKIAIRIQRAGPGVYKANLAHSLVSLFGDRGSLTSKYLSVMLPFEQKNLCFPTSPGEFESFQPFSLGESGIIPHLFGIANWDENNTEVPAFSIPQSNVHSTRALPPDPPLMVDNLTRPPNRPMSPGGWMGVKDGRVSKPTGGTKRTAYGRAGRLACSPCRLAKKGWEVNPAAVTAESILKCVPLDCDKPGEPPCTKCIERGKPNMCDGARLPAKTPKRSSVEDAERSEISAKFSEITNLMSQVRSQLDGLDSKVQNISQNLSYLQREMRDMSNAK